MKAAKEHQILLLSLQAFDSKIVQFKSQILNLPESKELEIIKKKLSELGEVLKVIQGEEDSINQELKRSENDVELVDTRIERDEKRLASGTGTAKELEQTQHELQTLHKRKSELEEVELEIMVRKEAIDERLKVQNDEIEKFSKSRSDLEATVATKSAQLLEQINTATSERTELITNISAELVNLYEKIRTNASGVAAARLFEGKCEGCHLTLNAVEITRIKGLPEDEVVRCEECNRILVRV
jgi:predicted  nucleic acid-binding Zn-ribbon protein